MGNRKKLTYIVSDIDKALAFEWIASHFINSQINISFILINCNNGALHNFLKSSNVQVYSIEVKGKLSYASAYLNIYKYLRTQKPDIVHCHLRLAEMLGMTSAWMAGIKTRIYTRHSSTYNHLYHKKGVIIDKFINKLSTKIVSISKNVTQVLVEKEQVNPNKIKLIHHGFDLQIFDHVNPDEIQFLKRKYKLPEDVFIIGMISRLLWWKGFEYSIRAIKMLLQKNPKIHLIIANAHGPNSLEIEALLHHNLPPANYTLVKFENNVPALYKCFDVFVHVPVDKSVEAFGQIYVEALAAGIPSVFTMSGVAPEFIKDKFNALVVPLRDSESITIACDVLIRDEKLRKQLIFNGKESVKKFNLKDYLNKLEDLYLKP